MSFQEETKEMNTLEIDTSEMDRESAFLVYKGNLYEHDNHQYAFKQALEDEGLNLGYDIESEIDKVANETYNLSKNNEVFTFSVYDDGENQYFIAHFENHLKDGWEYVKEYIQSHRLLFGYVSEQENKSDKCIIFVSE